MLRLRLPLLLIFILTYTLGFNQVNIQWQAGYDNANGIDQSVGIVVDAVGNSYITGSSWNGTDFDIVTIKYDPSGVQSWVSSYDGPNNYVDEARGIAIDKNGFIYVTGQTNTAGALDYDIVTIKYDPSNGTEMWSDEFTGTANFDQAGGIATDTLGFIYVIGTQEVGPGNNSVVVIKYDAAGVVQWTDSYNNGISGIHFGKVIKTDLAGNVYALSEVESSSELQDYSVMKYLTSSTGNPTWTQTYDADGVSDVPEDIFIDTLGNLYVTGGAYTSNLALKQDYYTIKVNSSNGAEIWGKLYNGSGNDTDIGQSVVSDTNGFVYITGNSVGAGTAQDFVTVAYDGGGNQKWVFRYQSPGAGYDVGSKLILDENGEIYASGTSYLSATNNDYVTLKFDSLGNKLWETRFDGPASNADNAIDMFVDAGKNIYITGKSKAPSTNFDFRTIKYCQLTTLAGMDTSICYGDSAPLFATGGTNFTWSVFQGDPMVIGTNFSCNNCQNPIASPDSTTIYVVSSTSGSGCVDFDTVTVTVNPLPGPVVYSDTPLSFCTGDSVLLYTDSSATYTWSTGSDSISTMVYATGSYSVTVVDTMGCNNSTSENVTAFVLPTITGGLDSAICFEDTIQLSPTGGVSYVWLDDPSMSDSTVAMPFVWPGNDMSYTVIGTDANNCSDTGYVFITVNPLPAPPTITRIGDNLQSSYTTGNQWVLNGIELPGETDFLISPGNFGQSGNGNYWIIYTDVNGCKSTSSVDTVIWASIEEFELGNEFKMYPNPVHDNLLLNFTSTQEVSFIRIVNSQGKILQNTNVSQQLNGVYNINTSTLPNGVYLLQVVTNEGQVSKRFIKE